MDNHMESGDLCVAFQVKNNIFAIPWFAYSNR